MRTLTSTQTVSQRLRSVYPLYKMRMQYGATDVTYTATGSGAYAGRIISIDHTESYFGQQATIVLSNHDNNFGTSDFRGFKITISYGLTTPAGDEYDGAAGGPGGQCAPLYVVRQIYHSSPGRLTLTLFCSGILDLMGEDHASAQFTQDENSTYTIKTLLSLVSYGALYFGHCLPHYVAIFDSEDQLLDSFLPADAFYIPLNRSRLWAIQELLWYCKSVVRAEDDGEIHFLVPKSEGLPWAAAKAYEVNDYVKPSTSVYYMNWAFQCTTAGTSGGAEPDPWTASDGGETSDGTVTWTGREFDYTYESLQAADNLHEIYAWNDVRQLVVPNRVVVSSHPETEEGFTGEAEDTGSSDLTYMEKTEFIYARVTGNAQCARLAEAILDNYRRAARTGGITVPMNIGAEVHDYIEATDYRHGSADRLRGNIETLRRVVGQGNWYMEISFGKSASQGMMGPITDTAALVIEDPEMFPGTISLSQVVLVTEDEDAGGFTKKQAAEIKALATVIDENFVSDRDYIKNVNAATRASFNHNAVWHNRVANIIILFQEQLDALEKHVATIEKWLVATIAAQGEATIAKIEATQSLQAPLGENKNPRP